MKKSYIKQFILLMLFSEHFSMLSAQDLTQVQLQTTTVQSVHAPEQKVYFDDKIFVKFRQVETGASLSFNVKKDSQLKLKQDKISEALLKADARLIRQAAGNELGNDVARIFQVELDGSPTAVLQLIDVLNAMPEVEYAERVPIYYEAATPNDPGYISNQQYSLTLTKAIEAFTSFNSNSNPVKVAIVDDAVLTSHTDLKANIWVNPGETGLDVSGKNKEANGIDDDNNGYIDDVNGWDTADKDNNPNPPLVPTANGNLAGPNSFSHGTHCAGIAGAVTGNGIGIASISNNKLKIVPVKAVVDNYLIKAFNAFDAVVYAINGARADVVSMSFGGQGYSQAWQDLINASTAKGIVFVAAAMNENIDKKFYPAAHDNVISVSSTDASDIKSNFSNFGEWVTISAPGTDIYSTVPGTGTSIASGSYTILSGTSMATPMVSGLAGLLKVQNPALTAAQIRQILTATSDNIDILNPGFEGLLGAGRMNAYQAALAAGGTALAPTADFFPNKTDIVIGEEVTFVNRSTGKDLTYLWTFTNANITTSTLKDPKVKFTAGGLHDVILLVNGVATKTVKVNVADTSATDILGLPLNTAVGASNVNGHSINNIPAFANAYKYASTHLIAGVNISFRLATAGTPNSTIRVKVWDDEKGIPGQVLYTQEVKISDLKANGLVNTLNPNYIYFDKPVQIPPDNIFYVGFEIDYNKGDNVSIHHFTSAGTDALIYFSERWQTNAAQKLPWTFAIFPIIAEPAQFPSGNITVSPSEACIGDTVNFSAANIRGASSYNWVLGNGTTFKTITASTQYKAEGTYEPTLTATKPVTILKGTTTYPVELRNSFTQKVWIADCGIAPVAAFEASAFSAPVGTKIKFTSLAKHATNFEWVFTQGAYTFKSTEESPEILFVATGKYDVTLTVRNPEKKVSVTTKMQYVEIFTKGFDCYVFDYPFPSWLSSIATTRGGTLSGHNGFNIADFAKLFSLTANGIVSKVLINFSQAASDTPATSFITVKVWDATGINGTPGNVLSTTAVSYATIQKAIETNKGDLEIILDKAAAIPADGKVYIGFTINYVGKDNIIASTLPQGPNMGTRSLYFYAGNWFSYKQTGVYSDYAIGVGAFMNAINLPSADFIASALSVPVGIPVNLDASSSKNANIYRWEASGGSLSSTVAVKTSVVFNKAGTYDITLYVQGNCDNKVAKKSVRVVVTATTTTLAKTDMHTLDVNKVYPNPSEGVFNVQVNGKQDTQLSITVWNFTGKQLFRKDLILKSASEMYRINLSNQPSGIYFLKVSNGNKSQVYRLVKV